MGVASVSEASAQQGVHCMVLTNMNRYNTNTCQLIMAGEKLMDQLNLFSFWFSICQHLYT